MKVIDLERQTPELELKGQDQQEYLYEPVIYMARRRFWDWLLWWEKESRKNIELGQIHN